MASAIEQSRIEAALIVLHEAVGVAGHEAVRTNGVSLALRVLRRHVDDAWLKQFWDAAGGCHDIGRSQGVNAALNGIERNLKARAK